MKKLIIALTASVISVSLCSAETTIFDPSFAGPGTPTGYTTVTNNGGTVTYSNGTMVTGDDSVNQAQAYITSTSTAAEKDTILTTNLTFTSNYTANGGRTYSEFPVLSLYTSSSNNPLLEVDLISSGYNTNSAVQVNDGLGYGGGTTVGNGSFQLAGLNTLSGVPITLHLVTTYTNLGVDPSNPGNNLWELTNIGTVTADGSTQAIDLTTTGSIFNGYDPIDNPLTLQLGTTAGFFSGGTSNGGDGFLTPPASVDIDSLSITAPEPSVCALMLGGVAVLGVLALRRKLA